MWTKDEAVGSDLLSNIINQDHENVKYLPGYLLPKNVIAVPNLADVCSVSNILIFALPHQYLETTLNSMKDHLTTKNLQCVSLIKGQSSH
jgi:glycerol-3-phosphate dehydrogenase (NAD+)